jgi:hypothetical protein
MYPLFHPSIHQHKVPNLLPCTSSSIHLSSLCTHFFIHPSINIRYPTSSRALLHPSIRHRYVPIFLSIHFSSRAELPSSQALSVTSRA